MPFAALVCGPQIITLSHFAAAIIEECSTRGVVVQVVANVDAGADFIKVVPTTAMVGHLQALQAQNVAAFVLCDLADSQAREQIMAATDNAVLIDWIHPDVDEYEKSVNPHLVIENADDAINGLAQVFALLEGLGYIAYAGQAHLTPKQDAELVDKLKQLGYV